MKSDCITAGICPRGANATTGLATLVFVALISGCASRAEQSNPFFAMDTWFRGPGVTLPPPTEERLDLLHELGYDGYSSALGEPEEMAAVARQAEQRDLKLVAVYTGATLTREGLTFEPRLDPTMAALGNYGTCIWLTITSSHFAKSSPEGDDAVVQGLRALADAAKTHKLRIALYPHAGNWMERLQDAVRLARKTDRPNLGVTFNLCHCLQVGDEERIPQLLEEAAPYLFLVTINGADTNAAGASWDRLIKPLDQGTCDLRPLLTKLHALHYKGPIGLQGYGTPHNPRENLTRSMNAWRDLNRKE